MTVSITVRNTAFSITVRNMTLSITIRSTALSITARNLTFSITFLNTRLSIALRITALSISIRNKSLDVIFKKNRLSITVRNTTLRITEIMPCVIYTVCRNLVYYAVAVILHVIFTNVVTPNAWRPTFSILLTVFLENHEFLIQFSTFLWG
jgi:hypothetical protein